MTDVYLCVRFFVSTFVSPGNHHKNKRKCDRLGSAILLFKSDNLAHDASPGSVNAIAKRVSLY